MSDHRSFLEKRVHSRVAVKIPVQFHPVTDPKELKKLRGSTGLARDLSLEGMYLKTPGKAQKGDILRLDISLPMKPRRQLFAFAEVVWVRETGAGLKLLLMPSEDRTALQEFLDKDPAQH
ncbi:MAG TPA: PilZ domain-containing protein [bacterium]|nr:PilZ domain-containing protein [bacterium]